MTRSRTLAFRLAAAASVFAAFYHATAIAMPEFGRLAYPPGYPLWRHIVFVLIDGNLGWLLLRRPIWLIWPYAALTVQAAASHGGAAWMMWRQNGRIDWISIVVVIGLPLVLGLLYVEWRNRRASSNPTTSTDAGGGRITL